MTKSKYGNRRARGGRKCKPPVESKLAEINEISCNDGKKKGGAKAIDMCCNDHPIALGRCAFAIASSASGNNGGFREALRLKPRPPAGPPPEQVRNDPARQLKGGKGGSEILLPGAYVDGGDALPGAYVDFHGGV